MSGVTSPAPWRIAFDNARDPYTARNALGAEVVGGGGGGGGFITSVSSPLAVTGGNLTIDLSGYQPLDGDLTAIAALTGTNTIYYRSGTDTWSPVVVSTGLSFSGGNLTATGGGGNVSNSGTPAAGQLGEWVTATTIKGIAKTSLPFLPLTGVTDGSNAAAGDVGEYLETYGANVGPLGLNVWNAVMSRALSPGDWEVSGSGYFYNLHGGFGYLTIGPVASNINAEGLVSGYASPNGDTAMMTGPVRYNITSSTTIYMNVYGNINAYGVSDMYIRARRIR